MKLFKYTSLCLFGAHGETDYIWCLYIRANDEEKALHWGHEVADEYDKVHRLQPNKIKMNRTIIEEQGHIEEVEENDLETTSTICHIGNIPDFSEYIKKKR